jgi:hypothetical protein
LINSAIINISKKALSYEVGYIEQIFQSIFTNTYQAYRKQAGAIVCKEMLSNGVPSLLFSLFPFVLVPELR